MGRSGARRALLICAAVGLGAWILLTSELSNPGVSAPPPAESRAEAPLPERIPFPPAREEVRATGAIEPALEVQRGVVIGRILNGRGQPVPDCEVVLGRTREPGAFEPEPGVSGRSDRAGRFRLDHPGGSALVMRLRHRDYPTTTGAHGLELPPGQSIDLGDLVLRSQPGLVVRTVSSATGLPLAGARVELEPLLDNPFLPDTHRALRRRAEQSDQDGHAAVYGLREGRYRLRVTAEGHAGVGLIHSQPRAARAPDRLVSLPPGVVLRGRVLDRHGIPLAGALIRAEPVVDGEPGSPTRTDPDGRFLIPDLRRQAHRVTVESRTHGLLILEPVVVDGGDAPLVIEMPGGLSIRGTVLSEGLPVAGARVEARPPEEWPLVVDGKVFRPGAVTDRQGSFDLGGLPEGRFLLRVQSNGFALFEPLAIEAGDAPIVLNLKPACQVGGKVLDPGGRPVDGAHIEMLRSDDDGTEFSNLLDRVVHGRDALPRAETGAGGRFQLGGVPPGSYRLRIRAPGHAPLLTEPFQVPDAGSLSLPAALLRRGASISGRALRADGTAAQGALLVADPRPKNRPGFPGAEVTTATDGAYFLGPLAAGSYELFYYFPRGQTLAESAESRRLTAIQVQLIPGVELVRDLIHR